MTPYYDSEGITIYHGDCREILPTLDPVDLLCTDPPYGIGEARGKNVSRVKLAVSQDYGVSSWDDSPASEVLVAECRAKASNAIIFGGNYYTLPPSSLWLVWDKMNGKTDFADCELAWTDLPGAVRLFRFRWQGMLRDGVKQPRTHPTEKPVELMRWALGFTEGATVLDPFMGSGTTLRAAKDLGRKAIGIELEESYCEVAAKRMSQKVLAW